MGEPISGVNPKDEFGSSVSLSADGNRLAVGAIFNDQNGISSGHVRIFEWDGSGWEQLGQDIPGEGPLNFAGFSVSLSDDGSRVAIGAPFNADNGVNAGQLQVYEWNELLWEQLGSDIEGENEQDLEGASVSISGDGTRVVSGAPINSQFLNAAGQVRIFIWQDSEWVQMGSDIFGEAEGDRAGFQVAISSEGNHIVVGATNNDGNGSNSGQTRVFHWNGASWIQVGNSIYGEAAGDESGYAVSISSKGKRIAIGALRNDGNGIDAGHARIFEWKENNWIQLGHDLDGFNSNDQYGLTVSLSDNGARIAVGYTQIFPKNEKGAQVFEWSEGAWNLLGDTFVGEASGDEFGFSVSLSTDGSRVAIGAPGETESGDGPGFTKVYEGFIPVPTEIVPTMGQWGTIILALLVLILGSIIMHPVKKSVSTYSK